MNKVDHCTALAIELRTFTETMPLIEHSDEEMVTIRVKSLQKLREDALALANALLEARA